MRQTFFLSRLFFILTMSTLLVLTAEGQAPRAIPVEEPQPVAPRASVVEEPAPRATVVTDGPEMNGRPAATPSNKPKGPDQDLFDYAMLAYEQKEYRMAAQSFGQYLTSYPTGGQVAAALYRLGNCYRIMGQLDPASQSYREVISSHANTDSAPSAAFWLGRISFEAKDYKAAGTYFNFCETKSTEPNVKLYAAFYLSECQMMMGDKTKQLAALKRVLAVKENNPLLEQAQSSTAAVYQLMGRNAEALPILMELAATAKDPKLRVDAKLKAAIIQTEQKKPEEAIKLYRGVLDDTAAVDEVRGAALVGLVTALLESADYDGVIDAYNRNAALLPPPDLRPRLLLTVGNAHRLKKSYARAVDTYAMVEQYYAETDAAFEAGYWKINCLYLLEDKQLVDAANEFVLRFAQRYADHANLHMARLMVAETHFAKNAYTLAAQAFQNMDVQKIPAKFHESTLYHKGWSESEAGKHTEAVGSLGEFITRFPKSADLATALAKQGFSYMQSKQNGRALEVFDRLIKEFPENPATEMAYYLSGVIHNDKASRNVKAMIQSFETLMAKFPTTGAYGEASFNCGLGYLELKDFDKAIPHLRKAIKTDQKNYGELGTQKLILALWAKKDVDNLAPEVDAYRGTVENAVIPPTMLGFLGLAYTQRKEWHRSAKYFTWAVDFQNPSSTDARLWRLLAEAQVETKSNYSDAVVAIDHFLTAAPADLTKAKAYHTKAVALLGMGKHDEALAAADEGLKIARTGGVQGLLLIVQGDALLAQGDQLENKGNHDEANDKWTQAAAKYVVPSQMLQDDVVTPQALDKAAKALERKGDKDKAQQLLEELKRSYPQYSRAE
jgi:tetratricopeptide (TPR) repeat protein